MAENETMAPQVHPDVDLPYDIEGLDVIGGLRRMLGKKPLYLSLLRKFVAGQKSAITNFLQALEVNDWETAERVAHTLKGVSGNIGASNLQQLAERLEFAVKEHQPRKSVKAQLDEIRKPLESLIAQLEQKLPEEQGKTTVVVNQEKLKEVCDKLKVLLTDDDSEAVDFLGTNADLLNTAFPDHFRKLEGSIRSFDYEAALLTLGSVFK
jgi:HPt (histidine-containing phosphotransfer) domain-containing protein